MTRNLVLAALVSCAALLACKGSRPTMDLPVYPGSTQASSHPNQESAAGTLSRIRRQTPDGVNTVAAFYRKELGAGRGWSEVTSIGPAFSDGNLTVERPGQGGTGAPADPSRPGGFVVVYENRQRHVRRAVAVDPRGREVGRSASRQEPRENHAARRGRRRAA